MLDSELEGDGEGEGGEGELDVEDSKLEGDGESVNTRPDGVLDVLADEGEGVI